MASSKEDAQRWINALNNAKENFVQKSSPTTTSPKLENSSHPSMNSSPNNIDSMMNLQPSTPSSQQEYGEYLSFFQNKNSPVLPQQNYYEQQPQQYAFPSVNPELLHSSVTGRISSFLDADDLNFIIQKHN